MSGEEFVPASNLATKLINWRTGTTEIPRFSFVHFHLKFGSLPVSWAAGKSYFIIGSPQKKRAQHTNSLVKFHGSHLKGQFKMSRVIQPPRATRIHAHKPNPSFKKAHKNRPIE